MTTKYETGTVWTGKVTGIQPYGAFVALDEQTQGLVHISEIKHGFVKDIHEFLSIGDEVKVKVLEVHPDNGKISLSIKATEEAPVKEKFAKSPKQQSTVQSSESDGEGFNTLKDKLQEWIKQSENKDVMKK
ncbi:S1 domain-containing post-transcriptional regulator GSP13 [Lederbergia sp. NSJ-179]|uniref:S1 domain-containing post-transcriptional regulator GSP13 n=1 Tax=Lederbergia sp. NSJ-179 TaxID=2931402 RepID=UPI001FD1F700|nr:S1 domain-containing post-transcriptional regulator GSP13 [Lederbergia sp. NSJ-179]MCJ7843430.1 S1 domain-containing post-transcriptional regulator GSP13 [Lederbergia sp. NSJ-179]